MDEDVVDESAMKAAIHRVTKKKEELRKEIAEQEREIARLEQSLAERREKVEGLPDGEKKNKLLKMLKELEKI